MKKRRAAAILLAAIMFAGVPVAVSGCWPAHKHPSSGETGGGDVNG